MKWDPLVREFTNACIDDLIERGRGDFVEEVTNIVPAVLTMAMIAMPLEDWVIFNEPAHASIYTPPDSPDYPRVAEMRRRWRHASSNTSGSSAANPRPGMLKALIDAEINGEPFADINIMGTLLLVIGGGFDTTTALTSNVWRWLAENPEEKARLMAGQRALEYRHRGVRPLLRACPGNCSLCDARL